MDVTPAPCQVFDYHCFVILEICLYVCINMTQNIQVLKDGKHCKILQVYEECSSRVGMGTLWCLFQP